MNDKYDKIKTMIEDGYTISDISITLGVCRNTVSNFCKKNNINPYKATLWTNRDSEQLSKLLETYNIDEIPAIMKKPRNQILYQYKNGKVRLYNSKLIDKEKEKVIKTMIDEGYSYNNIGDVINVNRQVVAKFCKSRGWFSINRVKWTEESVYKLTKMYESGEYTIEEIAKKLRTTYDSVSGKAQSLGLKMNKTTSNHMATQEEIDFVLENHSKMTIEQMSQQLKRSKDLIKKICVQNNINKKKEQYEIICENNPTYELDISNPAYSGAFLDRKYKLKNGTSARLRKRHFKDFKQMVDTFLCKTTAELAVEDLLIQLDLTYIYEHRIDKWKVDYYLGHKMIIEVQGEYWHSKEEVINKDIIKFDYLKSKGYHILEIKEEDINTNRNNVLKSIESFWVSHRK